MKAITFVYLPAHGFCVLHLRVSFAFPIQSLPPFIGLGLVQDLCLYCLPCPHVPLQTDHLLQLVHPPLTEKINNNFDKAIEYLKIDESRKTVAIRGRL